MDYERYIKIPWTIVLDKDICSTAKVLYGILYVLSLQKGYCYANNKYLANMLNVGTRTITRLLHTLASTNYIKLEYIDKFKRKVFINNMNQTSINLDNYF